VVHGLDDDRDVDIAAERKPAIRARAGLYLPSATPTSVTRSATSTLSVPWQSPTHDTATC
jgi:hypothetical protein